MIEKKEKKFVVVFSNNIFSSNAASAFELYNKSLLGERVKDSIHYSFIEALYLLENKKITIREKNKTLANKNLLEKAKKLEPNFWPRYKVFQNLKSKGYVVKTALKFGADFRVYSKGTKPGQEHAKWLVFPAQESSKWTWYDLAARIRVAHNTKKNLLIAIVDHEGDITYYEINWIKP